MVRVAINGFGRIGRMFLRAAIEDKMLDIVAVNDLSDAATLAYPAVANHLQSRLGPKFPGTQVRVLAVGVGGDRSNEHSD